MPKFEYVLEFPDGSFEQGQVRAKDSGRAVWNLAQRFRVGFSVLFLARASKINS